MASLQLAVLAVLTVFSVQNCDCFKPFRVGDLVARSESQAGLVGGLVYLLNHRALYIRDFHFDVPGSVGYFCIKITGEQNYTLLEFEDGPIDTGFSVDDIELSLPNGLTVANVALVGVCGSVGPDPQQQQGQGSQFPSSDVLASVSVVPETVTDVPCNTTFLGEFPGNSSDVGSNGQIEGRVYLLDRVTFAVLGFSYSGMEPDAFFWCGSGDVPSASGFPCIIYGTSVVTSLSAIDDQDLVLKLPSDAIGTPIEYLAVWCRTNNISLGHVSFDDGLIPTVAPPAITNEPTDPILLGSFTTRGHSVRGDVYVLDERTFRIDNFNYDGTAPGAHLWAVKGSSVRSDTYWILPDETGSLDALSGYSNQDIVITIPQGPDYPQFEGITINDFDWLSVWCRPFSVNFGEVEIPDDLELGDGNVMVPTLPPIETCDMLQPIVPEENCKMLSNDVSVRWTIDEGKDDITITLCGCVLPDNYIAFGLSGSDTGILMFGSDVVWTWMDNGGAVHAQDLYITDYAQCLFVDGGNSNETRGVCPDPISNSVRGVSGSREGCTTCVTYTRPLAAESITEDKPITPGSEQYVIWAMGPVGSLRTPQETEIPIPFKHYSRASNSEADMLLLDFGRAPVDECSLSCPDCVEQVIPWSRPTLPLPPEDTTILAQIGPSGGQRGYFGITGISGWGIAWYLNGSLIPEVRFRRGVTYTFITEGGDDPNIPARYHPFYLTDNERGGYLVKSRADQEKETIYAGFDGDTPIGVGRYCEYRVKDIDRSLEFDTFEEYKEETLELVCDPSTTEGSPGMFQWTPDNDTPDTIYYQCATHQFLGYKATVEGEINVTTGTDPDPTTDGSDVPTTPSSAYGHPRVVLPWAITLLTVFSAVATAFLI